MAELGAASAGGTGTPSSPGVVRVRDNSAVLEFSGEPVGRGSTAADGKLRWVEITLYRVDDGTGRRVLHRVGKSLAYHKVNSPCNRGIPKAVSELSADMQPCPLCNPPELSILRTMPWERVNAETDHHGAVVCQDAAEAVERLRMRDPVASAGARNVISADFSAPAQQLLDEARTRDPEIAAVLSRVRRLLPARHPL